MQPEPTWVSVSRYCELYDVNRKTVYKYMDAAVVDYWQVGRVLRIRNLPPGTHDPVACEPSRPLPTELPVAVKRRRTRRSLSLIRVGDRVVPDTPGVYVIRSGEAVKIGCSKALRPRLGHLQTFFPHPIAIVGYIERPTFHEAVQLESVLHAACAEHRVRGEWFRFTPPVAIRLRSESDAVWDERAMLK